MRGSRPGLYDLESDAGPMRSDARLRRAAHITAIIPPFQARRIIRSAYLGKDLGDVSSLENPAAVEAIRASSRGSI